LVQSASANTALSSSITASFGSTPTAGNLLVAIESNPNSASSFNTPSGWTLAVSNANSSPGQVIFYKLAGSSESKSVIVNGFPTLNLEHTLRVLEFSGLRRQERSNNGHTLGLDQRQCVCFHSSDDERSVCAGLGSFCQ
jgi:hypothetical protein